MLIIAAHFTEEKSGGEKKSFLMVIFTKIWLNVAKIFGGHRPCGGILFVGKCEQLTLCVVYWLR